jgi:hypothetical protein
MTVIEIQLSEFEANVEKYVEMAEQSDVIVKDGDKKIFILMGIQSFEDNLLQHLNPLNPSP